MIFLFVLLRYFEGSRGYKCLILLLFNAVDLLLANTLMSFFLWFHIGSGETLSSPGSSERILFLLLHYFLELAILSIAEHIRNYELSLNSQEWTFILLFFLCVFATVFILYAALRIGSTLPESHDITILFFSLMLILFLIIFLGIYMLKMINKRHHDAEERKLLQLQISEQSKQLVETKKHFESIRQIRHDMKRYLANYRLLLTDGKTDEVLKSIAAILDEPLEAADTNYTDNLLLNAMLHAFRRSCLENSIILEQRIILSPLFENIDLMILLSNLFDNALEAELLIPAMERQINIEIVDDHSYVSIIVQNHIEKSVLENNPKLESTKTDGNDHGIGLKSVYKLLEKNHGNIDIYEENELFCVHVLFPKI